MRTAVILHGSPLKTEYYDPKLPAQSHMHWIPWVQRQLMIHDILTQTPEMPHSYNPRYEAWKKLFEQFRVDENTVLIGHSAGAGFIVRWLSENQSKVNRVILVAPWIDPGKELDTGMFDFTIDPSLAQRTEGVTIFIDRLDDKEVVGSADTIHRTVEGSKLIELPQHGHFTRGRMGTEEFPELIKAVLE